MKVEIGKTYINIRGNNMLITPMEQVTDNCFNCKVVETIDYIEETDTEVTREYSDLLTKADILGGAIDV